MTVIMRRISLLVFMVICSYANAEPFVEVGLGYAIGVDGSVGKSCLRDWKKDAQAWGCSSNPLGYAAIGYEYNGFTLAVEHWSAITEYDAGIDIASVKYRHRF